MGKVLKKLLVITVRGTDLNLIPQYGKPRQMILLTVEDCAAIFTGSAKLDKAIFGFGGTAQKITVLRSCVDLDLYKPMDRTETRTRFAVSCFAPASVGNLIPTKGPTCMSDCRAAMLPVLLRNSLDGNRLRMDNSRSFAT